MANGRKHRRGRYTPPSAPRRGSGLIDPADVPPGYLVVGDGLGNEQLVWAPELIEGMRDNCPICRGEVEGEHGQVVMLDAPS